MVDGRQITYVATADETRDAIADLLRRRKTYLDSKKFWTKSTC